MLIDTSCGFWVPPVTIFCQLACPWDEARSLSAAVFPYQAYIESKTIGGRQASREWRSRPCCSRAVSSAPSGPARFPDPREPLPFPATYPFKSVNP